jgi:hypothetical protein
MKMIRMIHPIIFNIGASPGLLGHVVNTFAKMR